MTDEKDEKQEAKIFKKPIHHKATRKVSALPRLLARSKRPDGERASRIDGPDENERPTRKVAAIPPDDEAPSKEGPEEGQVPDSEAAPTDKETATTSDEDASDGDFDIDVDIDDGGLFDEAFDD